ncbi:DUF3526 domain-containing protein [Mucilaginibacter sp. KACC 22063]|uniref:DUF3526 domain-containing protein n=1 Tax=Mucilaginibacter sp. KACC 22063 TaxID=3025666 RepID=UPI002366909A|nr:DUF3526 domain-containing protein [Mucilaginibacter sp. KACC 22063]WDF55786.1 DUF3526 domain-containing protein [Mucilaginibacter sp. KACC 22063]
MIRTIFHTEYLQLKRSPALLAGFICYLLLGAYSIYYGRQIIHNQQEKIAEAVDSTGRAQAAYVKSFMADTTTTAGRYNYEKAAVPSLVRFNYPFLAMNRPGALSSLCIGQRDLFPLYYPLTAQSYYVQTLKGDIYNPFKLKAGNFDLAFVIVYLMPLLLCALCFDVLSTELRSGTDRLLIIASGNLRLLLLYRLLFRSGLVMAATLLLCLAGFAVTGQIKLLQGLGWILVTVIYALFWTGINFWVNSFKKDGTFNAIAVLTVWVSVIIIIPSAADLALGQIPRTQETKLAALMRSRNMPETDSAMNTALQKFYVINPRYQPKDTQPGRFYYFQGYSAFLFNGDRAADSLADMRNEVLAQHQRKMSRLNMIDPAYNTSEMLSMLAGTTLADEWAFKSAARSFHRNVFWFSNRPLFEGRLMNPLDYLAEPKFQTPPASFELKHWFSDLLVLTIGVLVFWLAGWIKLKNSPSI